MHNEIMAVVEKAWSEYRRPFIMYKVGDANGFDQRIFFPNGYEVVNPNGMVTMLINLSTNACRMFSFNEENQDFVYNAGFNGTGFLGNIPIDSILLIYDDNDKSPLWVAGEFQSTEEAPEPIPYEVVCNADNNSSELKLVVSNANPNKTSPTYVKWAPVIIGK